MTRLPKKPSDLIEVALNDLKKIERSKRYVVNMDVWFEPDYGDTSTCAVCFAGSVMAKTLGANPSDPREPESFDFITSNALIALDEFRREFWRDGFEWLDLQDVQIPEELYDIYIPIYEDDPAGFKRSLRKAVRILRKEGL